MNDQADTVGDQVPAAPVDQLSAVEAPARRGDVRGRLHRLRVDDSRRRFGIPPGDLAGLVAQSVVELLGRRAVPPAREDVSLSPAQ
ncbi:hypothetical protein ACWGLO_30825 [Streptomyces niveus]